MKLQPINDRIIVQTLQAEEKSAGGIILPDSAKEKPLQGKVLATGPGKTLDNGTITPIEVNVGDTIIYGKYSGTEVTVDGTDYIILKASDILAVLQGAASMATVK